MSAPLKASSSSSSLNPPVITQYEHNALILLAQKFRNNIIHKNSPDSTLREIYYQRADSFRSILDDKLSNYCFNSGGGSDMFLKYWVLLFEILSSNVGDTVMGDIISGRVDNLVFRHLKKAVKHGYLQEVSNVKSLVRVLRLEEKHTLLKCVRYFEQIDLRKLKKEFQHSGCFNPNGNRLPALLSPSGAAISPQQPSRRFSTDVLSPQRRDLAVQKPRPRYRKVDYSGASIPSPAPPLRSRPVLPSLVRVVEYPTKRLPHDQVA